MDPVIRDRLLALKRRVERAVKNLLREHGVRVLRVLPVEVRLTGYRGRTRRFFGDADMDLDDTGFADIFNRVPPHARTSFLNGWENGESKERLIAAYALPERKPFVPLTTLEGYLVQGTEWEGKIPPEPTKETEMITITETLTLEEYEERVRENLAKGKHARRSGD